MSASENTPVGGVVIRNENGKYLLAQEKQPKAYGLWNLPAGWQNPGETLQETAIREAKEEVGFDVELLSDKPLVSMLNDSGDRMLNSFIARVVHGELQVQKKELLDARWFAYEEIKGLFKDEKLRARWVLESIKKVEE